MADIEGLYGTGAERDLERAREKFDALAAENARLVAAIQGALGVLDAMVTPQSGTAIMVSVETIAQVLGDELRAALAGRADGGA